MSGEEPTPPGATDLVFPKSNTLVPNSDYGLSKPSSRQTAVSKEDVLLKQFSDASVSNKSANSGKTGTFVYDENTPANTGKVIVDNKDPETAIAVTPPSANNEAAKTPSQTTSLAVNREGTTVISRNSDTAAVKNNETIQPVVTREATKTVTPVVTREVTKTVTPVITREVTKTVTPVVTREVTKPVTQQESKETVATSDTTLLNSNKNDPPVNDHATSSPAANREITQVVKDREVTTGEKFSVSASNNNQISTPFVTNLDSTPPADNSGIIPTNRENTNSITKREANTVSPVSVSPSNNKAENSVSPVRSQSRLSIQKEQTNNQNKSREKSSLLNINNSENLASKNSHPASSENAESHTHSNSLPNLADYLSSGPPNFYYKSSLFDTQNFQPSSSTQQYLLSNTYQYELPTNSQATVPFSVSVDKHHRLGFSLTQSSPRVGSAPVTEVEHRSARGPPPSTLPFSTNLVSFPLGHGLAGNILLFGPERDYHQDYRDNYYGWSAEQTARRRAEIYQSLAAPSTHHTHLPLPPIVHMMDWCGCGFRHGPHQHHLQSSDNKETDTNREDPYASFEEVRLQIMGLAWFSISLSLAFLKFLN